MLLYCRGNGPKNVCWALALFEEVQWFDSFEGRLIVKKT